jgi:signal transduction histidine kinase
MRVLRTTCLLFLPMALISAFAVYWLYSNQVAAYWATKNLDERHVIDLAAYSYSDELDSVVSDLRYLANQPQLQEWLADASETRYSQLAADYRVFAEQSGLYDQIRFIGTDGIEKVRVDWNGGNPSVVPKDRLQDKKDRYYVAETAQLELGAVYVSSFDLNNEFGVLETPLKPMIRFATPVFDEYGDRRGIVILNYLGRRLLERLAAMGGADGQVWIANRDGHWLLGPSSDLEWGFMFPDQSRPTFGDLYPEVWPTIASIRAGQLSSGGIQWTYATLGGSETVGGQLVSLPQLSIVRALPTSVGPPPGAFVVALATVFTLLAGVSALVARHKVRRGFAEARVVELNAMLEDENQQLVALNQDLESFSYSVSHDLRAPVRAISGFCGLVSEDHDGELSPEALRKIGVIKAEAERLGTLIDGLLGFFKGGRGAISRDELDMTELARHTFERALAEWKQGPVELRLEKLPRATGDRTLIEQVWTNLLSNAIKFSSKSTTRLIEISGKTVDGEHVYTVKDHGAGFDPRYQEKLFGVFQRLHGDGDFAGTGIGLALVHKIVTRHGGRIWAEGQLGKGATFHFSLPADQDHTSKAPRATPVAREDYGRG